MDDLLRIARIRSLRQREKAEEGGGSLLAALSARVVRDTIDRMPREPHPLRSDDA